MGTVAAIELLLGLLDRAVAWGAVVAKAQAEGRDITDAELDAFAQEAHDSSDAAKAAIKKARGG